MESLNPVTTAAEVISAQRAVREIFVSPEVKLYMVEVARQTRSHAEVYLGASPRGSLALYRTSQARAALMGRDFVLPDDVKALVGSVLGHRIILGAGARLRDLDPDAVIKEVLKKVAVPRGPGNS